MCLLLFVPFKHHESSLGLKERSLWSKLVLGFSGKKVCGQSWDQLLRDDANTVSTSYTSAIIEYQVVIHDPTITSTYVNHSTMGNGNVVFDIHHPWKCLELYTIMFFLLV